MVLLQVEKTKMFSHVEGTTNISSFAYGVELKMYVGADDVVYSHYSFVSNTSSVTNTLYAVNGTSFIQIWGNFRN